MNKIYNIFDIEYGQRIYHSKGFLDDFPGKMPLISSGGQNNGIYGYFGIDAKYKNVISVPNTGTIGHAFYQGNDCCIDDNCLVMIPKKELSIREMFYYVMLIRKNKYRFMYGRQITPKKLGEITIPEQIPSRVYTAKIPDYSDIKDSLSREKLNLSDRKFEYFEVKDLFDVYTGGDKPKDLEAGKEIVNSIENLTTNNGVKEKIKYSGKNIFENFISVVSIGDGGKAFYQKNKGVVFTRVKALVPKKSTNLNNYIGLFLVTILNKESYRYGYGRVLDADKMKKTKIKLPVDTSGNPDRNFMENYIKSLPYSKYL